MTVDGPTNPSRPSNNVVIVARGGFNPPTYAHMRMFERARDYLERHLGLIVVEGVMSPLSDHSRKLDLIPSKHRVRMVEAAIRRSTWIRCGDWESTQPTPISCQDVLAHYKKEYARKFGASINVFLLCGADAIDSLSNGHGAAESNIAAEQQLCDLLFQYPVVAISRPHSHASLTSYLTDVIRKNEKNFHLVEDETYPNDASSTRLRIALRRGESIKYCTSDEVIEYISDHNLYLKNKSQSGLSTIFLEKTVAPTTNHLISSVILSTESVCAQNGFNSMDPIHVEISQGGPDPCPSPRKRSAPSPPTEPASSSCTIVPSTSSQTLSSATAKITTNTSLSTATTSAQLISQAMPSPIPDLESEDHHYPFCPLRHTDKTPPTPRKSKNLSASAIYSEICKPPPPPPRSVFHPSDRMSMSTGGLKTSMSSAFQQVPTADDVWQPTLSVKQQRETEPVRIKEQKTPILPLPPPLRSKESKDNEEGTAQTLPPPYPPPALVPWGRPPDSPAYDNVTLDDLFEASTSWAKYMAEISKEFDVDFAKIQSEVKKPEKYPPIQRKDSLTSSQLCARHPTKNVPETKFKREEPVSTKKNPVKEVKEKRKIWPFSRAKSLKEKEKLEDEVIFEPHSAANGHKNSQPSIPIERKAIRFASTLARSAEDVNAIGKQQQGSLRPGNPMSQSYHDYRNRPEIDDNGKITLSFRRYRLAATPETTV